MSVHSVNEGGLLRIELTALREAVIKLEQDARAIAGDLEEDVTLERPFRSEADELRQKSDRIRLNQMNEAAKFLQMARGQISLALSGLPELKE